jgi:F-type H+-transporting ATPase subunit b
VIPDLSVLWVIALFLLCVFVLNTLVFKPILAMSESRSRAVRDARELAESAAQKAAEASTTFDRTLSAARAEVYGQMDEALPDTLALRATQMAATKQETERALHDATSRLATQANAARTSLERDAAALAGDIVGRVLGRTA